MLIICDILWRVIEKREFIAMLVYIVEIDYYYTHISISLPYLAPSFWSDSAEGTGSPRELYYQVLGIKGKEEGSI